MSTLQRLILILAGVWIVVKLVLFYSGNELNYTQLVVSLNIGFTLYIIYKALKGHYAALDEKGTDFLQDFKISMKAAVQFSLIIFGFLAIYYLTIDTGYTEGLVDKQIELIKAQVSEAGGYDLVMEENKSLINLPEGEKLPSEEEHYETTKDNYMQMIKKVLLPLIFIYFFILNLACSSIMSGIASRIFGKQV